MSEAVNTAKRTRRAEKAQETYRRIVEAATRLFLDRGYVPTTIDAIADAADVAVETVYARFRTKANLMVAVKDAAVTEGGGIPLAQRPELAPLTAETDQRRQLQIAAALSRGMLQRVSPIYALLRDVGGVGDGLDRGRHVPAVQEQPGGRFDDPPVGLQRLLCAPGALRRVDSLAHERIVPEQ